MRILVCDDFPESGIASLRAIPDVQVDAKLKLNEAQLIKEIPAYDIAIVRSATKFTAKVIAAASRLQVIARAGMGYDNVDLDAATRSGVVVMNTPGSNAVTTAEHTIALMMALSRNIPQANGTLKTGQWERKGFTGTELAGKTLGIVGLGNVGREVARRACGLRMVVLGYDPFISPKAAEDAGVVFVELEHLYHRSDFISLHTVLNDQTRHMIDAKTISKLKDRVRIINCARGGLVDEKALLEGLKRGKVAGAALDVFEQEPVPAGYELIQHPNVVATPHLGASTDEAQEKVAQAIVDQVRTYIEDEVVINGVNVPAVSRDVLKSISGYIDLGQRMGAFLGQLEMKGLEEVRVECAGEILKYDTAPISTAVLCGLMRQLSSAGINFVNAPMAAKERGVKLVEARSLGTDKFLSLVSVTVRSADDEHTLAGTVFGKNQPRLIQYDHYQFEVVPRGQLIVIQNEDRPGVVGSWGTILGRNNINIAQMQVALADDGKRALAIVNIDSPAPAGVLEELRKVPGIFEVRQLKVS